MSDQLAGTISVELWLIFMALCGLGYTVAKTLRVISQTISDWLKDIDVTLEKLSEEIESLHGSIVVHWEHEK